MKTNLVRFANPLLRHFRSESVKPNCFVLRTFLALLLWHALILTSRAQGAAFIYEGRLTESGAAATGVYEMEFKLFDSADAGVQQGSTISYPAVTVTAGTFTAPLDFGAGVFDGSPRFLEISVKKSGDAEALAPLAPRQSIAPVPVAAHSLSAAQLNGVPASNILQANASGNVGIGTSDPAPGVRLEVNGPTRVSAGGSGGYLQIGTPGGETGLSAVGDNRFDLRFNGQTLALAAGANSGPIPYENGVIINTNGNVGIGLGAPFPASPWKLEVHGPTRLKPTGASGAVQFSTPNGETGMSILGANRADVRFDDATLKLVAGPGNGTPGNGSGIAINTAGNVAIGKAPDDPNIKLDVSSGAGIAVFGRSSFEGIHGESTAPAAAAVAGINLSTGFGVYGESKGGGYGGFFIGKVRVGTLEIAGGADLAEPFRVRETDVQKGWVLVIDAEHPGQLKVSAQAYDKRVAGIVSGANGINPGIHLRQEGVLDAGENVALTGRVYVWADAESGSIEPGDLLTTSSTPGHAMKVDDHVRAQGAILGKAMSPLKSGKGLVLTLVTLQ